MSAALLNALAEALLMAGLCAEARLTAAPPLVKAWHPGLSATGVSVVVVEEAGVPWFGVCGGDLLGPCDDPARAAEGVRRLIEPYRAFSTGRRR